MQQQQNAHYLQVISSEILYFYKLLHLQKKKKNLEFVWNFWLLAAILKHQIVYCADVLQIVPTWNSSPDLGELTFILWRAG